MSCRALLVMLVCSLASAGAAVAQGDDVERAKRHVEKAEQHYSLAEFPAAVEEFKAAYRLAPRPGILFNLGQCYLQLKDYANAEFSYRAYLRAQPDAENKQLVEELITQAGTAAAAETRARQEASAARLSSSSSLWTAGITATALGAGVALGALTSVSLIEVLFLTDVGSAEARTGLFWSEKALGAAAAMGIGVVILGGTLAISSSLVE